MKRLGYAKSTALILAELGQDTFTLEKNTINGGQKTNFGLQQFISYDLDVLLF